MQADIRQRYPRLIDSRAPRITHSHRSWHSPSSLANPTKITLGENSNIPAASTGHILIQVHASGQQTCAVLQDILHVDSRGSSLFVPHLYQQHSEALNLYTMHMEVNDPAPTEITTLSIRNTEATITTLATHPLHTAESGAPLGLQHRHLGHPCTDVTSHMAKKGLANGLEISGGSTTSGPCDPHLKGKQTHEKIRKLLATQTQNGYEHLVTFSGMRNVMAWLP
jgi:hypothetical protein